MGRITEDDIKHSALGFLKTHYKYRPRIGETQTQIDNISKSGIIVDALITFQTDLQEHFEAAIEATSSTNRHEVLYRVRKSKLWWDATVVGTLLTTLLFSLVYNTYFVLIGADRVWLAILAILFCIFLTAFTFKSVFRSFSRYRKIYALEQFKLYDADEQWVAISHDLFTESNSPKQQIKQKKYINELKRQCVLYGFGLLIIEEDLDVRQVITPSKIPLEGRKRRTEQFTSLEELQTYTDTSSWRGRFKNYADTLTSPVSWEKERRFRKQVGLHIAILLICATVLGIMLWREAQKTKIDYLDNDAYRNELLRKKKELTGESKYYKIEEESIVPIDSTITDYNLDAVTYYDYNYHPNYNKRIQDSIDRALHPHVYAPLDPIFVSKKKKNNNTKNTTKTTNSSKPRTQNKKASRSHDAACKQYRWKGKRYILQDGVYSSKKNAEFRIQQINKAAVLGGIIKGSCFKGLPSMYIVYVDKIYTSKNKATTSLPHFNQWLKDKGYSSGELILVEVRK